MNALQRIILVLGSIGLVSLLFVLDPPPPHDGWQWLWQWKPSLVRAIIVSAATTAAYFAATKRKG
jgi:hypothetical protein